MPRDGSPLTPARAPEPLSIGEVAEPPFAVLPRPDQVFLRRAARFEALSQGHHLAAYLRFLAEICRAQHTVLERLPPPELPAADRLARAHANAMPPLAVGQIELGETADRAFAGLLDILRAGELTQAARGTVEALAGASSEDRRAMMRAVLVDQIAEDAVAAYVLAAAAVQVHLARLAARLDAGSLVKVADGACPACGGAPVASAIVGWEGAHGTRFCTCSLCATQWNVPRIRCLVCGEEKGVAYKSLPEVSAMIAGETCDGCKAYVKILHQHKDAALDPVADDVATLALDLKLGEDGWQRASVNAFLMGY
jgi:FdhE protein